MPLRDQPDDPDHNNPECARRRRREDAVQVLRGQADLRGRGRRFGRHDRALVDAAPAEPATAPPGRERGQEHGAIAFQGRQPHLQEALRAAASR